MQTLDLGEGGLKTIPLRFILFSANRFGDRIFEDAIVLPELKLPERGAACKELSERLIIKLDATGVGKDAHIQDASN